MSNLKNHLLCPMQCNLKNMHIKVSTKLFTILEYISNHAKKSILSDYLVPNSLLGKEFDLMFCVSCCRFKKMIKMSWQQTFPSTGTYSNNLGKRHHVWMDSCSCL